MPFRMIKKADISLLTTKFCSNTSRTENLIKSHILIHSQSPVLTICEDSLESNKE